MTNGAGRVGVGPAVGTAVKVGAGVDVSPVAGVPPEQAVSNINVSKRNDLARKVNLHKKVVKYFTVKQRKTPKWASSWKKFVWLFAGDLDRLWAGRFCLGQSQCQYAIFDAGVSFFSIQDGGQSEGAAESAHGKFAH